VAYWLMKSEPDVFSIDALHASPKRTTHWDGVRNYQARNFMRDGMKNGDEVFFYHSNCEVPAIVGIAKVVREAYPDHTAFDPDDPHFDPKSKPEAPAWLMVDIQFVRKLKRPVTLQELKAQPRLQSMALVRKGNRLSVMSVSDEEWQTVLEMERA
jgi:predicted RNA-binding protein with PUA-like domain